MFVYYRGVNKMIEFKESYDKVPNSSKWGPALDSVVSFMATLQGVVKKIDARVANLESDSNEDNGSIS